MMNISNGTALSFTRNAQAFDSSLTKASQAPTETEQSTPRSTLHKTFAETFYVHEQAPWEHGSYSDRTTYEHTNAPVNKASYLLDLNKHSEEACSKLMKKYAEFRTELGIWKPEIARKNIGFTMNENGDFKIIDHDTTLVWHELNWLTDTMNSDKDFKKHLHAHAKSILTIAAHDRDKIEKPYDLNVENFQKIIDYGKLDIMNGSMSAWWVEQVKDYASHDEAFRIDIQA